jgi:hypothetical protein
VCFGGAGRCTTRTSRNGAQDGHGSPAAPGKGSRTSLGYPSQSSNFGLWHSAANRLAALRKLEWVPNSRGEQPQRRPGVRERFRAASVSPRCTAARQKRPNSWASAGGPADGETVRIRGIGGGTYTGREHSFRWGTLNGTQPHRRGCVQSAARTSIIFSCEDGTKLPSGRSSLRRSRARPGGRNQSSNCALFLSLPSPPSDRDRQPVLR